MNDFRKQIHDYITDNEEKCVPNIKFKSGKTKLKKYIEVEVKKGCGRNALISVMDVTKSTG